MEMLGSMKAAMALSLASHLKGANTAPAPSPNGCRYNPEAGVGILSAVMDSAAARLRVVEPVRHRARGILEVTPDLCCRGYCGTPRCSHRRPFRPAECTLSCKLCRHWIAGGPVYMYKGEMGFCKAECRYEYIMQELQKERQRRAGRAAPAPRRMRWGIRRAKAPSVDLDGGEGRMFFTCVEIA